MDQQSQQKFEAWCVVELYGHNRIVGLVSEQSIGGAMMVRVDVPDVQREASKSEYVDGRYVSTKYTETIPAFTKFFGQGAIYAITPVSEEIARAMASSMAAKPISAFEIPKLAQLNEPSDEDD